MGLNDKQKGKRRMKKLLIGGQALKIMGSTRHTDDSDFLVNEKNLPLFSKDENGNDLLNAAKSKFFMEIWKKENGNEMASPQSLLELKAFAFVEHCQNHFWQKADDCEFDIRFLVRNGAGSLKIACKYMTAGQADEINKIIENVRGEA
jgi:hypothetical protein